MISNGKYVLALIPARGGSKGVKRKNLRVISGKPLIEYSVSAAKLSDLIDRVYVSSEDEEILEAAQRLGVETIRRPMEFASDTASANSVVLHFIGTLSTELREQDPYILYLQPTSPLRTNIHIESALKKMAGMNMHTLVSVCELKVSPYKSFRIDDEGFLQSLFDEELSNARRQDLPLTYVPNGAIYVFRISDFIKRGGFPSNGSMPFIMSEDESIDVDTEGDILRLERILEKNNG